MVKKAIQKVQSANPIIKWAIGIFGTLLTASIIGFTGWTFNGIVEAKDTRKIAVFTKDSLKKTDEKFEKIDEKVDKIDNRTIAMERTLELIVRMIEKKDGAP